MQNSLRNGLDVAEGSLAGASGDQSQGLVDAAKRGNIDGLRGGGEDNGGRIMAVDCEGVGVIVRGQAFMSYSPDDVRHLRSRYEWNPHGGTLAGWRWQEPASD